MDLLDFDDCELYFETPLPEAAAARMAEAASLYGTPEAESALLAAYRLAPGHLTVLVGLYRYYFYQHRLDEALSVADEAMRESARLLGLPTAEPLEPDYRQIGGDGTIGLLRFHLMAMKASAIVLLRSRRVAEARERLMRIARIDSGDRLDSARLIDLIDTFHADAAPCPPARGSRGETPCTTT